MTIVSVLSVKQPYASWIVYGSKFCENRTWSTSYRGRLYIHASSWVQENGVSCDPDSFEYPTPVGCIIGSVDLLGCWSVEMVEEAVCVPPSGQELQSALQTLAREPRNFFGWDGVVGPVCWLMADRKPLAEPVEVKGKLRIWKYRLPE